MGFLSRLMRPKTAETELNHILEASEAKSRGYLDGKLKDEQDTNDGLAKVLTVNVFQAKPELIPSSKVNGRLEVFVYLDPSEREDVIIDEDVCKFPDVIKLDDSGQVFGTELGAKYYHEKKKEDTSGDDLSSEKVAA